MSNGEVVETQTDVTAAAWLLNTLGKAIAWATIVGVGLGVGAAALAGLSGVGLGAGVAIGSAVAALSGPLMFAGVLNNARP